jgi:stage II sporulation protein D (peptidoglycan lytic transglycosylase)
MRGKLVVFILVLAAGGLVAGWKISHDPQCFIGARGVSAELAAVPRQGGFHFPAEVRVCLTTQPVGQAQVTIDGPYRIRSVDGGQTIAQAESPDTILVVPTANGFRVGPREVSGAALEIETEGPPAIWVDDHLYRGRLRCVRQGMGRMLMLNVVRLEDYIASVVDGEMPAAFPEAARQAQAIVARTYALYQIQANRANQTFDVYATTRSQNYLGYQYRRRDGRRYAAESPSSRRAADETAGMVCLADGKLFCTYYTAVCGGRTASGSDVFNDPAGPLESVECEWCHDADLFEWRRQLSGNQASDVARRYFAARGKRFDALTSIRRIARTSNVREPVFELGDGRHRYRVSAVEFRRMFSATILSYQFEPALEKGQLVIEGRGHGHGVGLCQWGARGMAQEGAGPVSIVRHYYPGADVVLAVE